MNIIEMFDKVVVQVLKLEGEQFALKREIKLIMGNTELEIPGELEGAEKRLATTEAKLARYTAIYNAMVHDHSQHVWAYVLTCNKATLAKGIEDLNALNAKYGNGKVYTVADF